MGFAGSTAATNTMEIELMALLRGLQNSSQAATFRNQY